jgi:hypothetical protein
VYFQDIYLKICQSETPLNQLKMNYPDESVGILKVSLTYTKLHSKSYNHMYNLRFFKSNIRKS